MLQIRSKFCRPAGKRDPAEIATTLPEIKIHTLTQSRFPPGRSRFQAGWVSFPAGWQNFKRICNIKCPKWGMFSFDQQLNCDNLKHNQIDGHTSTNSPSFGDNCSL